MRVKCHGVDVPVDVDYKGSVSQLGCTWGATVMWAGGTFLTGGQVAICDDAGPIIDAPARFNGAYVLLDLPRVRFVRQDPDGTVHWKSQGAFIIKPAPTQTWQAEAAEQSEPTTADDLNAVPDDRVSCVCSIETIMQTGCVCGGK